MLHLLLLPTQTAQDQANIDGYCSETLVLSASFNEAKYKFDLKLQGSNVIIYTTNWVNGQAENIRFTTDPNGLAFPGEVLLHLQPGTDYIATLVVENSCDDQDTYLYNFSTPTKYHNCLEEEEETDPGTTGTLSLVTSPNPTNGNVDINFDGTNGEIFSIKTFNMNNGSITTLVSSYIASTGVNAMSLNMTNLQAGHYTIKVQSNRKLYQGTFIKH